MKAVLSQAFGTRAIPIEISLVALRSYKLLLSLFEIALSGKVGGYDIVIDVLYRNRC